MKGPRPIESRGPHVHLDEDGVFEAALAPAARSQGAEWASCAACLARVHEARANVAQLRAALAPADARDERLVERVLAATSREPLDWRGDLRLVTHFVRERLRASSLLRIAAAVLVVHFAALPLLAWIVFRAEPAKPHFYLSLEPLPRKSPFAEEPLEELRLDRDLETAPLDAAGGFSDTLLDQRRLVESAAGLEASIAARATEFDAQAKALRGAALPLADDGAMPSHPLAKALWARARLVQRGEWRAEALDAHEPLGLDVAALRVELELDRTVLSRSLATRAQAQARVDELASRAEVGKSALARRALARALRLGFDVSGPARGAALEFDAPFLDIGWRESLRESAKAAAAGVEQDSFVRAWFELR